MNIVKRSAKNYLPAEALNVALDSRNSIIRSYRKITAPFRLQPNFFIIGVQKGGTSSLFQFLRAHPSVITSLKKEPFYYCFFYNRGELWYRSNFPLATSREYRCAASSVQHPPVGEASTHYIFYPKAAERLFKDYPHAKLILLLRNPTERAFSHWNHMSRRGIEKRSFEQAIEDEINLGVTRIMLDRTGEQNMMKEWCEKTYISHGIYLPQIKSWLEFFDKKQLLILGSEDMFKYPNRAIKRTLSHLNVQPQTETIKFAVYNRGKKTVFKRSTREMLVDYYRSANEELFEFIGESFEWT